jgi:hypothetical protein
MNRWWVLGLALVWLSSPLPTERASLPESCGAKTAIASHPIPQTWGVFGGGGAPDYNEIALEKNFRYFQRSLQTLGIAPDRAAYFFASGDRRPTVRYLDPTTGEEKFKPAEIPHVQGGSTRANLVRWFEGLTPAHGHTFFYFTGHGARNRSNAEASGLWLWPDDRFSVQEFTRLLDRLPPSQRFVAVMSLSLIHI